MPRRRFYLCNGCGRKFRCGHTATKCSKCKLDGKFVLVYDPTGTYPEHSCEFFKTEFRGTLREGVWPPGSIWKFEGRHYIIRGNEQAWGPKAPDLPPQTLESIEWAGVQPLKAEPLRNF